jgi:hypothetical protein
VLVEHVIEVFRRLEVVAEGFFDDEAAKPTLFLAESSLAQMGAEPRIEFRRNREIKEAAPSFFASQSASGLTPPGAFTSVAT